MKIICKNKKAFFDYLIEDQYQAGIVLSGDEVKSLRSGSASLSQAYALIRGGELFLINFHIQEYSKAYFKSQGDSLTRRNRKLLMKKREISKLAGLVSRKGLTLIPLQIYFNDRGLVKVDIATAKHKQTINKKQEIKERDISRQAAREIKERF